MRPDGCLIHKGRKDLGKIRGYGVEPAEVEKVLNGHTAVGQAVVVAQKKGTGESRLVAYYTCLRTTAPTVSELRSFLREQLPDFMIPSVFVMVDTIPLTHSGKLDRRALPEPDNVRPELSTRYLSARNEIEQKLVGCRKRFSMFVPSVSTTDSSIWVETPSQQLESYRKSSSIFSWKFRCNCFFNLPR